MHLLFDSVKFFRKRKHFYLSIVLQTIFIGLLYFVFQEIISNANQNSSKLGVPLGLDFLWRESGFVIDQTFLAHSVNSPNINVLFIGILNTLFISFIGIVISIVLSFFLAILQASGNWFMEKVVSFYVNLFRNIPLLIQIIAIYAIFIRGFPPVKKSIVLFKHIYINNRGFFFPVLNVNFTIIGLIILMAIIITVVIKIVGPKFNIDISYYSFSVFIISAGVLVLLYHLFGNQLFNITEWPKFGRFNIRQATQIYPEFICLLVALIVYTTAFNIEIIRAGFDSVSHGQYEAAKSLGLTKMESLRKIILPQALAFIIPAIISQCLNLTKDSSLGIAVGYTEILSLFVGVVLMQTGKAIEIISITMIVYLTISLITSLILNIYNKYSLSWKKT